MFRAVVKVLSNEIKESRVYNNAATRISNTTGKAQEKLTNIQKTVAAKYDVLAKQVSNDTSLIETNPSQLKSSPLPNRVAKWWQWYQQLTGLDIIEVARRQVISAQDKLFKTQDERRLLNREAALINNKLKEVYSELIQTKRDDPKYVQLTIIENKSLQDQARIMSQLNLLDREEKDHFTQLATAIKEYHDSQAVNAQKYKYLSILASALGAIISLIGSMIYNNRRIVNIRSAMFETQEKNEKMIKDSIHVLETDINAKFSEVLKTLRHNSDQNTPTTENISYKYTALAALVIYVLSKVIEINSSY